MEQEGGYYVQLRHIMRQKSAKIGGVPFLTIPQGVVVLGMLGLANVLGASMLVMIISAAIGYAALYVHQGEFVAQILLRVLVSAVRVQIKQAPTIELTTEWQALAAQDRKPQKAAVVYRSEGATMVSEMGSKGN